MHLIKKSSGLLLLTTNIILGSGGSTSGVNYKRVTNALDMLGMSQRNAVQAINNTPSTSLWGMPPVLVSMTSHEGNTYFYRPSLV